MTNVVATGRAAMMRLARWRCVGTLVVGIGQRMAAFFGFCRNKGERLCEGIA